MALMFPNNASIGCLNDTRFSRWIKARSLPSRGYLSFSHTDPRFVLVPSVLCQPRRLYWQSFAYWPGLLPTQPPLGCLERALLLS